jgi:hypothetical protein
MSSLVYLHGFASSPYSTKAEFFRQRCAERRLPFIAPDLNQPSFARMTMTAGMEVVAQAIADAPLGPVYLIGSSLGALTALHLFEAHPKAAKRVARLVLLAPGLALPQRWGEIEAFGDVAAWRETGWQTVYNYATDQMERIHYAFYEDALQYDGFSVKPPVPTHIVHGRDDGTVPVMFSQRYDAMHANISLDVIDAEHGMTTRLGSIWGTLLWFFGFDW